VSRTRWCARTQLSHRYSLQSLHLEVARLPSSHELHILLEVMGRATTPGPAAPLIPATIPPVAPSLSNGVLSYSSSCDTTTSSILLKKKFDGRHSTPESLSGHSCLHVGHLSIPDLSLRTCSSKHLLQKVWRHGSTLGSSKRLKQRGQESCSLNWSTNVAMGEPELDRIICRRVDACRTSSRAKISGRNVHYNQTEHVWTAIGLAPVIML
jgi:hypothetical protein